MQLMHFPALVAILLAGAVTLMFSSALIISAMIGKVNRYLPEDQQVSYMWGYPGKLSEIREQYKRFYPQGSLGRVLNLLWVLIVILMVVCTWLVGRSSGNL
jgi:hypothetical protein